MITKPVTDKENGSSSPQPLSVGEIVKDTGTGAEYKVTVSGEVEYNRFLNTNSKVVTIPKEVRLEGAAYKVISVAAGAFKGNKKLTKVTSGDHVTSIGANAFSGCTKLKTVTVGKNMAFIGTKAFYNCSSITKMTIPTKVAVIGKQAFSGCSKLKNITIKTKKLIEKM